jgi:hypothetical protein
MKLLDIIKSSNPKKKYTAIFCMCKGCSKCSPVERRIVHFGAKGYSDFTTTKDEDKKKAYLARHKANEDWNDPYSAGALSRWILWNKPTLQASIADYKKRFNL